MDALGSWTRLNDPRRVASKVGVTPTLGFSATLCIRKTRHPVQPLAKCAAQSKITQVTRLILVVNEITNTCPPVRGITPEDQPMFVIAIDVGGPEKIGWAASDGRSGSGKDIDPVLSTAAKRLSAGEPVALGFESPIWTPRRDDLGKITSRRGGAEMVFNRAWSAGAGCGVLAAGLGLMPWCFAQIARQTEELWATTIPTTFEKPGRGLFVWEAFVSGAAKATTHMDDASLALAAFQTRSLDQSSDVPPNRLSTSRWRPCWRRVGR